MIISVINSIKGDLVAARRLEFKKLAKEARRAVRHSTMRRAKSGAAAGIRRRKASR